MAAKPTMFVIPAPGRRVKDPITFKVLPAEGDDKPRNSYWTRRVVAGDCSEIEHPKSVRRGIDAGPLAAESSEAVAKTQKSTGTSNRAGKHEEK